MATDSHRSALKAQARRERQRTDEEQARLIAQFIISCGRDCYGWDVSLGEVARRFPNAPLRVYARAIDLVS
jgi:hypothetical protein